MTTAQFWGSPEETAHPNSRRRVACRITSGADPRAALPGGLCCAVVREEGNERETASGSFGHVDIVPIWAFRGEGEPLLGLVSRDTKRTTTILGGHVFARKPFFVGVKGTPRGEPFLLFWARGVSDSQKRRTAHVALEHPSIWRLGAIF